MTELNYRSLIERAVGQDFTKVYYLVHSYEEEQFKAVAVRVEFSGGEAITIRGASDGESLDITDEILERADLGEVGRLEVVNTGVFDPAALSTCLGMTLESAILEISDGKPKSFRLECKGSRIFFSNVGDDLNFDEGRFREVVADEGWKPLTTVSYRR